MACPKEVIDLIERFRDHCDSYHSPQYNETQVRREFIDPFFKALGWDIENSHGDSEAYKDVEHESMVRIGGFAKAPDYAFRYGGVKKFFVEAKKPSINLKENTEPCYQLRRYAWNANLPLSILTDFEEFAVYDCKIKPKQNDRASVARILYVKLDEYVDRWDEIASVFSKDAIPRGGFDKFASENTTKRGTSEVDKEFLKDIEKWRNDLAVNIALRNKDLSEPEINYAVTKTIDRIIFLRICEDRGIEDQGKLLGVTNGINIYQRMLELFRYADDRYNSGLFHFKTENNQHEAPDSLTTKITIDDKVLKAIIKGLYYPLSPFEFSVLPADILGQVYEQFLGKVIRLTKGHQAKVEDKPEVKKAGGVYYTPTYIVDYIVKNTVGKLLEGKTPKQIEKISVLDPACGSGSFLIGAYQCIIDWHRDWYENNDPDKWSRGKHPAIHRTTTGEWRVTTQKRKEILLNNIYGVDIDAQAVEVTKLSLLLKVLEGETKDVLNSQLTFLQERALPDLGDNIKCGNSLIGSDYWNDKATLFMDEKERQQINAFDWDTEFADIMKAGGFDAVIGNPPYVRQESIKDLKPYMQSHYKSFDSIADLYVYFIEKGVTLLKHGGRFSIIVSSSFLRANYGKQLRKFLSESNPISELVDFGGIPVFANAKDTYVCIPLVRKGDRGKEVEVSRLQVLAIDLQDLVKERAYRVATTSLGEEPWVLNAQGEQVLMDKLKLTGIPLGEYVNGKIYYGIKTGLNEAFIINQAVRDQLIAIEPRSTDIIKSVIGGQDIRRYSLRDRQQHMIVVPSGWTSQNMRKDGAEISTEMSAWIWFKHTQPAIADYLLPYETLARNRQDKGEYWWELRACDYYEVLDGSKIVYPDITKGPRFFLNCDGQYISNTAYCLGIDDCYVLAILNSRLFWFIISNISIPFGTRAGAYRYRLIYQYMEQVPIRPIDSTNQKDQHIRDQLAALAESMPVMLNHMDELKTDHERKMMQRQIDTTDRQIDQLIYELYGLTAEEINIVEGMADND